jgi:hypothetical protein
MFVIKTFFVFFLLFTSCNSDNTETKVKMIKTSKFPEPTKREINSKVGDTVIIIVYYNYSSGKIKRWINDKECDILSFESKKYTLLGDEKCEGCNGYDEYKFVGKKSGECSVKIGTISMKSIGEDTSSNYFKTDTYKVIIR